MKNLNPTYKCMSIIIFAIILSFTFSITINSVVFLTSFILTLTFAHFKKIILFLLPVAFAAIGLFMTGYFFTSGENHTDYAVSLIANMDISSAYNGLQLSTRIFAYAGVGMLFTFSTDGIAFVYSLQQQLNLSPKYAYGILAAFHLMPNMRREYELSKFALMTRGGHTNILAPITIMFVNAIRNAEHLSLAMESKGFEPESNRTHYHEYQINCFDILFLVVPNISLLLVIFL